MTNQSEIFNIKLCSGYGQFHSHNNSVKPLNYNTVSLNDIISMVKNPQNIDKSDAKWVISTDTLSRSKADLKNAQYYALWADIDKLNISFNDFCNRYSVIMPYQAFIYNTKSATKENSKLRVIIPLSEPIKAIDYPLYQLVLNDKIASIGVNPDTVNKNINQICYLPNRGEYYEYRILNHDIFNPSCWLSEIEAKRQQLQEEQIKHEKIKADKIKTAINQVQQFISSDLNPIEAYRKHYPLETALFSYGYEKRGDKYISPNSESLTAGVTIKNNKWHSFHGSDKNIGRESNGGGRFGDAFDLFVYYECSGDFNSAIVKAGNMFVIDGKTITQHNIQNLKKAESQNISISNEWGDPVKIASSLRPVEQLSDDIIPDAFRDYIKDISFRTSSLPDYPFAAAMVAISSIIGTGVKVRPKLKDDWTITPNLWGGIIGEPSLKKSFFIDDIVNKQIKPLEQIALQNFKDIESNYQAQETIRQHKLNALNDEIKAILKGKNKESKESVEQKSDGSLSFKSDNLVIQDKIKNKEKELAQLEKAKQDEPQSKRYYTNDFSIEKLIELNKHNPRGVLIVLDELNGLFKSFEKQGKEQDREILLHSWNGSSSYNQDRIGRGNISVEELCVSIFGGIQPDVYLKFLEKQFKDGNDGFAQRLQVLVYPDTPEYKYVDEFPDIEAEKRYTNPFQKIANFTDQDFKNIGAEFDKKLFFRFSSDASKIFDEFDTNIKIKYDKSHSILKQHFGKYPSLMPSIALIFHLVDIIDGKIQGGNISAKTALKAVKCSQYLESHANRIYSQVIRPDKAKAATLAEKIKDGVIKDNFVLRDIQRKGWTNLKTKEDVQEAIELLIEMNWLKCQTKQNKNNQPSTYYIINPKLKK